MIDKKVVEFIKEEQKKGIPDGTIRVMLTTKGWNAADIEEMYTLAKANSTSTKLGGKHIFTYILIIVLVCAVALGLYYKLF